MNKERKLSTVTKYNTYNREIYVWLVQHGFTDGLSYRRDKKEGTIYWSFELSDELNKSIADFYVYKEKWLQDHDPVRWTDLRVVFDVNVLSELKKRGFEPELTEPSMEDFRKPIWIFRKSTEFNHALDDIIWKLGGKEKLRAANR